MSDAAGQDAHLLPIVEAWDETAQLRGVRLGAPPSLRARYHSPGQYLEVQDGSTRSYFALAAAPGDGALEILVRRGSPLADAVAALTAADGALRVRDVLGRGFPLREQEGRDLVLVAAGSGIAPLRAVLQQVLRRRERYGQVALYYGQRQREDLAYAAEFPRWREAGVQVLPVLSGERQGYVQDRLAAEPPPFLGEGTAAFLCGMREMMDAAAAALAGRGVPREQIFENH